jgi:exosortase/archaeosortase family protein
LLLFYGVTLTPIARERAWPAYLEWNAEASGAILRALGENVVVSDRLVRGEVGAGLLIERGCDAVHPSGLFLAAVLAAPVALRLKLPALLLGPVVLMVTNLVRIVSLYFAQIHAPSVFELLHVEVWQAAFVFLAVMLWIAWARWALRRGGLVIA